MRDQRFEARSPPRRVLGERNLPALRRFVDANPEYFVAVNGEPPHPDEAEREFCDTPPAGRTARW